MNVKLKLSATVLAMLAFTLLLFYQNCAQQSGELSGSSVETGGGTPTGPYSVTCINQNSNPAHPQANIFNVEIKNLGIDAVVCADTNSTGEGCASEDPAITQNRDEIPSTDCPDIATSGIFEGRCYPDVAYTSRNGPWVRLDCPCFKTVKQNLEYKSNINGYKSKEKVTTGGTFGHYDLRNLAHYGTIYLYVKKNERGSFKDTGRDANGAFARCGVVR